jgi:cytoskeleton protein RodZ
MASGVFASTPVAPGPDAYTAAPTTPPPAIIDSSGPTVAQPAAPPPIPEAPQLAKTQLAVATPDIVVGARVTIKAAADCWIQVRAPDQSIVFSRVLRSGETYQVPTKTGLVLRTGNAGALEIAVDGKPAPSIGGLGMLRRNVALDPEALLGGTAVHG